LAEISTESTGQLISIVLAWKFSKKLRGLQNSSVNQKQKKLPSVFTLIKQLFKPALRHPVILPDN